MENDNNITISIPGSLAEKLEERCEGRGFKSVSSYVTYILRQVLSGVEEKEKEVEFSKADEEKVTKRLKDMGYID